MTIELAGVTISSAAKAISARVLSPVTLAESCLERIASRDPHLHAFLHVATEEARRAAASAAAETAAGRYLGKLHGIPIALKDVIDAAGMPATANSRVFRDRVAETDAVLVGALRDAGAVILGKLAAWECAVGGTTFDLPWAPVLNPWNVSRDPGGSSSGAAVAVAAGLCLGAIGTDTGGSIREPAAWCGIAGLKPTYGLVGCPGVLPASASLDHAGPMAWTSEDCALMLDAIAEVGRPAHRRRPSSFAAGVDGSIAGLRVGVVDLDGEARLAVDDDVDASVNAAAKILGRLGARIASVRIAPLALYSAVVTIVAAAESYAVHRQYLESSGSLYDAVTRQRLMSGAAVKTDAYVGALGAKQRLAAVCRMLMEDVDVLLMPTCAAPAPLLGASDSHAGHPSLTRPWNVTGNPALSVCSGFSRNGLPLAVQIVGRPFEDDVALRVGQKIEIALGARHRRPGPVERSPGNGATHVRASSMPDEAEAIARLVRDIDLAAELVAGSIPVGARL